MIINERKSFTVQRPKQSLFQTPCLLTFFKVSHETKNWNKIQVNVNLGKCVFENMPWTLLNYQSKLMNRSEQSQISSIVSLLIMSKRIQWNSFLFQTRNYQNSSAHLTIRLKHSYCRTLLHSIGLNILVYDKYIYTKYGTILLL